jgi:hypothetical protein
MLAEPNKSFYECENARLCTVAWMIWDFPTLLPQITTSYHNWQHICNLTSRISLLRKVQYLITQVKINLLIMRANNVNTWNWNCCDNTTWYTIFSLFSRNTSTCLGIASCPSSRSNNVYMQQHVPIVAYAPLASPKPIEVQWLNKLKINSASSLFHYMHISYARSKNIN